MTAQYGRTVSRYVNCLISDGSAMRSIKVNAINGVGLTHEEVDLTAFQDAVHGVLQNTPDFTLDISGPFDTTANAGHAVLNALNGVNTPRSFDIQFGIQHAWESGEPQFGITATATSGLIITSYVVNPDGTFNAKGRMFAGSTAPAWGTTAEAYT